jgi:glucose-6-phosphate 1-dehydrogenase
MKTKLLIFGITGDLSRRKLLPALGQVLSTGEFDELSIIGVSRREVTIAELGIEDSLAKCTTVFTMDLAHKDDYIRLREYVALRDDEQLLVYLSVPPQSATQIADFLGEAGLNTHNVKILFEKPFGTDLQSAQDMIRRTAMYFDEEQVYRIDHYLAKEMAQNIVAFRGGNALFSTLWDKQAIASIEIIATEMIGIENRATFYEQTGALRDVLQGHLLQLLALVLMDVPREFDWGSLPALRLAALRQLAPADPAHVIRAQYEGYQDEVENPGSLTETFVSLELHSTDPHWRDVPLRLTTGKALDKKTTEIRIYLKKSHEAQSNCIVFKIQPDEGIAIQLFAKKPGYAREFEAKTLTFNFPEDARLPDAYEQVLVDAIRSHKSLFTSGEEVVASWEILASVQRTWDMDNQPLPTYQKGSAYSDIR